MPKKMMYVATLFTLLSAGIVSAKQLTAFPQPHAFCRGGCSLGVPCSSFQCRCILTPDGRGTCI